jgi:membrane AbrB-like protein
MRNAVHDRGLGKKNILPSAGGLAVCIAGGALCAWLKTPLPWMIGPLAAMAIVQFSGGRLEAPAYGRELGQLLIAVTLGLYFTPGVAREVVGYWPLLLVTAFASIGIGFTSGAFLARAAGVDKATAFFGSVPGGAAEMAVLGEKYGALTDRVALAHSIRILMVVTIVPVGITAAGFAGSQDYRPVKLAFDPANLAMLAAVVAMAGVLARRMEVPNAFMVGPLLATIAITASGIESSSMPTPLSNAGQVLLACALGARFQQSFLREAPRFVAAVVATVLFMITTLALFAWGLAWATGGLAATIMLACSPGGIAEMAITAKVLRVGVAFVTAAHVMRFAIVVLATEPTFRLLKRLARK